MEYSVRYIPIAYARGQPVGEKPSLCARDEKHAIGIVNLDCVYCAVKLDLKTHDKSRFVLFGHNGEEYPVHRFVARIENSPNPKEAEVQQLLAQYHNPKLKNPEKAAGSEERKPSKKRMTGSRIIKNLEQELGVPATKIRKFLRSKGLNAPYTNEKNIRAAIQEFGKPKTRSNP